MRDMVKTMTTKDSISFYFNKADRRLFNTAQKEHWSNIEQSYLKLRKKYLLEIPIIIEGTHKEWVMARVNLHTTTSIMRLLYLVESFCEEAKKFNSVAAAVFVKAMVEIPLHLGYLTWILDEHNDFESIRSELSKIAFGNRDRVTGLTSSSRISQREFYTRSDAMVYKFFKEQASTINIFEKLYKDANVTGHNNFEGREMLCGLQNDGIWKAKDRKELFVFYSNNIFQFFMDCDIILSISSIFLDVIEHYLRQLPTNFSKVLKVV